MFCSLCGKPTSDSARFCDGCGAVLAKPSQPTATTAVTPPPPPPPTKKKVPTWVTILVVLIALSWLGKLVSSVTNDSSASSSNATVKAAVVDDDCSNYNSDSVLGKVTAEMVLKDWKEGKSSAAFWVAGLERKKLYAVQDYQFLNVFYVIDKKSPNGRLPHASAYTFRVSSATQGGFPITKDWTVAVKRVGGECRVYDIWEDN